LRRPAFEKLVSEILEELPGKFLERIENVEFIVEPRPSKGDRSTLLLGLYLGTPLPLRSPTVYAGTLPDQIVIYQRNIEAEARRPRRIREVLRATLLHEIGHYFGMSERRLEELGLG
jgi:predicted Zn-dependent protease with MMP-like domain